MADRDGQWLRANKAISFAERSVLRVLCLLVLHLLTAITAAYAESADAAWRAVAGDGAVAILRHAKAPGASPDPPGFRIEDCATQRNLSAEGRAQAQRLGETWRARGAKLGKLLSSPWCRCRDTARLAGLGEAEVETALWNLLQGPPDRDAKVARMRAIIRDWKGPGTLVLVTHGITMRAVGLADPGEGGIVVVMPDPAASEGYRLVGVIAPP